LPAPTPVRYYPALPAQPHKKIKTWRSVNCNQSIAAYVSLRHMRKIDWNFRDSGGAGQVRTEA